MICPRCQTENADDNIFCKKCGWNLYSIKKTVQVPSDIKPEPFPIKPVINYGGDTNNSLDADIETKSDYSNTASDETQKQETDNKNRGNNGFCYEGLDNYTPDPPVENTNDEINMGKIIIRICVAICAVIIMTLIAQTCTNL